ncbi:hemin uptake protein HemP [Azoarcus olearius]|uniref:Hemin uptake protein n=1 Tax=Azoarcus sp. (strain BH72) TaxID=418699 RepID=A1K330_AZOSB|nr:hemin uptake protein HemP [Azoarcus olearius]CAL93235.1 putative hemin uptake protein [Azoarcus olearius]
MATESSDPCSPAVAAPRPERAVAEAPADEQGPAISSAQLLAGRPCVTIDHQGVNYVLRATRAGKLILTK